MLFVRLLYAPKDVLGNIMSNDFATKLISLRSAQNLTQQQLADAVGITPSQISRYESGQAKPRKIILLRLADALGVSSTELLQSPVQRVVVGERRSIDPPSQLRERMLKEFSSMDSEEIRTAKAQAAEAGVPFEQYVTDTGEEKFIHIIKEATQSGDSNTAALYLALASLLFGSNIKIVEEYDEDAT